MTPLSLAEFSRAVEGLLPGASDAAIARGVAALLPRALAHPGLLAPAQREGSPERYRQHLLHVDRHGRFSVVALVWEPGQGTPPHDHVAWCVVGIYEGEEQETELALVEDGRGRRLVPRRVVRHGRGDVTYLVPPARDIHKVENRGPGTAISIHVYGADIASLGSSIRARYEEEDIA